MPKILFKKQVVEKIKENVIINSFTTNKIYHLHNSYHLGDNVFNFIFFYLIQKYVEYNGIVIFYYAKKEYLPQLKEFITSKNILLSSLEYKPSCSIELWINNDLFQYRHDMQHQPINYNKYYITFFNNVLQKLLMNTRITRFYYYDNNLIERYNGLNVKYKNVDVLVLNTIPLSGQYSYNKAQWDSYIKRLASVFKLTTTVKVDELLCTLDDNLTIKDIAALSTNVKVIIAINSGVVPGLINEITLTNVKKVYIFDNRCYYSYPNFENKNAVMDISIAELKKYI